VSSGCAIKEPQAVAGVVEFSMRNLHVKDKILVDVFVKMFRNAHI